MKTILLLWCSFFCLVFLLVNGIVTTSVTLRGDVAEYHCYASIFWTGTLPKDKTDQELCHLALVNYHARQFAIPQEYPLLSVFIFSLPFFLPFSYNINFAILMFIVFIGLLWYLYRSKGTIAAFIFLLLITLGLRFVVFNRFDLLPSISTFFAIIFAMQKRFRLSYLLVTIGICLKIYPIVLLPIIFLYEQQNVHKIKIKENQNGFCLRVTSELRIPKKIRFRLKKKLSHLGFHNVLYTIAFLILYFLISYLIDPIHAFSPFFFQVQRPLQIESVPASIFWLLSKGTTCIRYFYGSQNLIFAAQHHCVVTTPETIIATFFSLAAIVGILAIYILFYQRKLSLLSAAIMLLFTLLITNKVLSPQYLLWIAPLLVYATPTFSIKNLFWLLIFSLTCVIFPFLYQQILHLPNLLLFTILVRNTLFVSLYIFYWRETIFQTDT